MIVKGGLSEDDLIAFPYGKDVKEGAKTKEALLWIEMCGLLIEKGDILCLKIYAWACEYGHIRMRSFLTMLGIIIGIASIIAIVSTITGTSEQDQAKT
ncbi:MAG: ABC transporter permease [Blautia wexlerae]